MNITPILTQKAAFPEFNGDKNVLARVIWSIEFEDEGYTSMAEVITIIDQDATPGLLIDELTDEQILEICLNQEGGKEWMDYLTNTHRVQIAEMKFNDLIEVYE